MPITTIHTLTASKTTSVTLLLSPPRPIASFIYVAERFRRDGRKPPSVEVGVDIEGEKVGGHRYRLRRADSFTSTASLERGGDGMGGVVPFASRCESHPRREVYDWNDDQYHSSRLPFTETNPPPLISDITMCDGHGGSTTATASIAFFPSPQVIPPIESFDSVAK